ncbi:Gfo/Idh/MocA family protein [Rubinisphaera margarita]|uniref:Gfo/Idh/MocA family protein n=1 Tax=Rubinisphaera margarita TaxID=2909586 RepID=UPI001EE8C684|nr:Gfo/Idh/MocA family oxidoreductase [Rubinisphaera margarita]MCG6155425.1 Gfo/Idh/MocA family oxidoreductase [Rubinisphaera margarita]
MTQLTRRGFVQSSLAAVGAGVFAAPHIARAKSPNDKLAVAVVGAGGRGSSHVSAFLNDQRTEITYIVDADEKNGQSKCDSVEKKQGFRPKFVRDMREAFDDKSVDIVSTATPNHWHALCGIWAMQAGKDAYVEKPVCQTIQEGRALITAARKYNKMCQVGTQCRSSKAVMAAVDFINEGGVGDVKFARGLCYKRRKSIGALGDYKVPESCDFSLWSGPATYTDPKVTRPKFHYDWHWQRHYGNGDLGNQGPHQTDIARWGLGLDRHPNKIVSYGGRLGYKAERNDPNYVDAGDTPNTIVSLYDYGDKFITFETRGLSVDKSQDEELNKLFQSDSGNKIGVVWYGSDGYVVQLSYNHCIAYNKDFEVIKEFKGGDDHFTNFVDACVSRNMEDLNADVEVGHLSAAMSHLGNISYYVGEENKVSVDSLRSELSRIESLDDNVATLDRTVKHLEDNGVDLEKYPLALGPYLEFDPKQEVFKNNEAANEQLRREYRSEFTCPTAENV